MELIYKVNDKPTFGKVILFALQQLLSILAGTITLPLIVGNGLSPSAALLGAGVGTFVYLVLTKFKSPIFLGSSFTFIGSMTSAFAGAASMSIGYFGILIGAFLAGLVYVILSIVIKHVGIGWINKVMPPVVIGPTVAIIGLTLAPNAVNSLLRGSVMVDGVSVANKYLCLLCGAVTLTVVILCSIYGKKMIKLIPFIIGILAGYLVAMIFTIIGNVNNIDALKIIDFSVFSNIKWVPDFALIHAIKGINDFSSSADFFKYLALIVVLYVPVAFVSFAEHIADHKNLSQIIDTNLIEDPGLHRTLLGDGIGSAVGSILGGCPNTTYGESISCVAFSRNASIITILATVVITVLVSFFGPLMAFCSSIPSCIIGGISIALYGFIASSGLQMLKGVDITEHKNIFVISAILVVGIGGLTIRFYRFEFSPIATALTAGLLVNLLANIKTKKDIKKQEVEEQK